MTTRVPPIALNAVQDSSHEWTAVDNQVGIDFTQTLAGVGWTAEFLIEVCGKAVYRATPDLDSAGHVRVSVPATVAAALPKARVPATYQISFTAPLPDLNRVWRGPVTVEKVTA